MISARCRICLSHLISKTDVRSFLLSMSSLLTLLRLSGPALHLLLGFATDVASTSPPNGAGFISSSVSSTNSSMMDYEVEVVEIRVKEGELNDILPH